MQVIKPTFVKAVESPATDASPMTETLSPEEEAEAAEHVDGFFGQEEETTSPPALPTNPFDLLFVGATGKIGETGGEPSIDQFSLLNVPTVQEWLLTHPEGRSFLDKFILKMESSRDNRFARLKKELEGVLAKGGLRASEIIVLQERVKQLDTVILKINQEIEKARQYQGLNQETYQQEKIHMEDLNGDGYVGDPADKQNSFLVGKNPVTGQKVLLNPETKTPAINPYLDPNYMPAVVRLDGMTLLNKEDQETVDEDGLVQPKEGTLAADAYLQIPDLKEHSPLIKFSAAEGFWVRKDKNGKPKVVNDTYAAKKFEIVTREDGTQMLGQKPPANDEREKWVFVQATDLQIYSSNDRGILDDKENPVEDVFAEFKDKMGNTIARIRVQGRQTNEKEPASSVNPLANGKFYTSATTMGIVVDGGSGKHSTRIRPMNVDASGFHSTGVLQLGEGNRGEVDEKIQAIMAQLDELKGQMEKRLDPSVYPGQPPPGSAELRRQIGETAGGIMAALAALHRSFAGNTQLPHPEGETIIRQAIDYIGHLIGRLPMGPIDPPYPNWLVSDVVLAKNVLNGAKEFLNQNGQAVSFMMQETIRNAKSADSFMQEEQLTRYLETASARHSDSDKEKNIRFGIAVTGIRGLITGTDNNDIFIIPPPDSEKIRELLPVGTEKTDPSRAAYGTYVNGGEGGNNIVISKGGDLFAEGVTFLWREAAKGRTDNHIGVKTNNDTRNNFPVFVHIEDPNPEWVKIYNGQDGAEGDEEGIKDDVYEVPQKAKFAMRQNDIPGGMESTRIDPNLGTDTENVFSTEIGEILKDAVNADPLAEVEGTESVEWEFGASYDEWEKTSDSFFGEWEFFNEGANPADEEDVGDLPEAPESEEPSV